MYIETVMTALSGKNYRVKHPAIPNDEETDVIITTEDEQKKEIFRMNLSYAQDIQDIQMKMYSQARDIIAKKGA